ncbi:hypothetical protein [Clostridium saccharoperbutylacetonicum]
MNKYTKKFAYGNLKSDTLSKFNHEEMENSCDNIISDLNKYFEKNQSNCRAIYNKEKNELIFPDNVKLCFEYLNDDTVVKFKNFNNEECSSEFEVTISSKNNKYIYYNMKYNSLYKLMNNILSDVLK